MIKRVCINCGVENYSDDAAILNWQCVNCGHEIGKDREQPDEDREAE